MAKARAAGGGIVYFPRGQYYIDGPIVVPDNVELKGEGEGLVSIRAVFLSYRNLFYVQKLWRP